METATPPPAHSSRAEQVPYETWRDDHLAGWEQGEHFTLIGPTGSNKTTTALECLLPRRDYVLAFVTKRKDPVIWSLQDQGYDVFRDWKDIPHDVSPRRVLAPRSNGEHDLDGQRECFRAALAAAFRQGGWTVYLDETRYVTELLSLARSTELLWHQGRSEGTTVVACAQRPSHLPLLAYSQATHLGFWKTSDHRDLIRMGEIGGMDRREVAEEVSNLQWNPLSHLGRKYKGKVQAEVLHIHTRENTMTKSLPPVKKF